MFTNLKTQIKNCLWKRFKEITSYQIDNNGYVLKIEDNLIPNIAPGVFQDDLKRGSGNELNFKFRAVHSSSALVVNTFANWKNNPSALKLSGESGFSMIPNKYAN